MDRDTDTVAAWARWDVFADTKLRIDWPHKNCIKPPGLSAGIFGQCMKEHVFVFFVHLKSGLCLSLGKTMQCDDMTVVSSVSWVFPLLPATMVLPSALAVLTREARVTATSLATGVSIFLMISAASACCCRSQEQGCGQCLCTGDPPASCLLDRLLITARHNTAAGLLPTRTYGEKKLSIYSIHY